MALAPRGLRAFAPGAAGVVCAVVAEPASSVMRMLSIEASRATRTVPQMARWKKPLKASVWMTP